MFKKKINELDPPPISREPDGREIARIWAKQDGVQQVSLEVTWDDPAAWGLMLVDLAKHIANAYEANNSISSKEALQRIKAGFDVEWEHATDNITN